MGTELEECIQWVVHSHTWDVAGVELNLQTVVPAACLSPVSLACRVKATPSLQLLALKVASPDSSGHFLSVLGQK